MPKKKAKGMKIKFPSNINTGMVAAVAGAIIVTTVAGSVVFAKIKGTAAALKVGGVRAGVWFDPDTGEPQVETGKFGCCRPMCSDSFELECQQLSEGMDASFDERKCSQIEECQKGCCQVDCRVRELPQEACTSIGGIWSDTCQIGCCKTEYSESEIPEEVCKCDSTATWYPGTCEKGWSVTLTGGEEGKLDFSDDWAGDGGKALNAFLDAVGGSRDQSIYQEYELFTCSDSVYDTWYGTKKTVTYYDGETETEEEDTELTVPENGMNMEFDMLEGGVGTVGIDIKITGNLFTIDYEMPFIGDIHLVGTIQKGAEECQNRKSLDDF